MISLIIPTYQRAEILGYCLESLTHQTEPLKDFEILVIDNNSKDSTRNVVESYQAALSNLKIIHEKNQGACFARNRGIREASGEFVAIIDDDVLLPVNFIRQIQAVARLHQFDCWGGAYTPWYLYGRPAWFRDEYNSSHRTFDQITVLPGTYVNYGGIIVYRKTAITAIGGYDTRMGPKGDNMFFGEEDHVQLLLKSRNYIVAYDPELTMQHLVPRYKQTPFWFLKEAFGKGKAYWMATGRQPSLFRGFRCLLAGVWHASRGLPRVVYRLRTREYYWQNALIETGRTACWGAGAFLATVRMRDVPCATPVSLVDRYKTLLGLDPKAEITTEMILLHWALEKRFRVELLASSPLDRWAVFERCYNQLYLDCWWINEYASGGIDISIKEVFHGDWRRLLGEPPQKIYEVGSGKGELVKYLAQAGFECRATEITRERSRHAQESDRLTWGVTDGVHLDKFELPNSFDAVISNSVIEHLHPDDIRVHFTSAYVILKNGGRYLFSAPHVCRTPTDLSVLFGGTQSEGMHLKEYTYRELKDIASEAGFGKISAVWCLPAMLRRRIGLNPRPFVSSVYLTYLCLLEKIILSLPKRIWKRASVLSMLAFFNPKIFLVAQK